MLLKIHEDNPDPRQIEKVVSCLKRGGVIVYPTDTVYGLGCDISNHKAIEKIARLKNIKLNKAHFSFMCYDLSHLSDYAIQIDTPTYKVLKRALPGPYTFIFKASSNVPKLFKTKKKTVGIRVPDNVIPREIVKELGNPIVTTSIPDDADNIEYTTDPELIHERFGDLVDIVIDGGIGDFVGSTVIDFSNGIMEVIREGKGDIDSIL